MPGEFGASLNYQPARVHQPVALAGVLLRAALRDHGRDHKVSNAGCSLSGAQKQQLLLGQAAARHPQGGKDASERHSRCSLNVVVEDAAPVAILL